MHNAITDVPGLLVGHWTDREGATGCTVVLCPEGAVAGVDVRGSAPGTRETDALRPENLVQAVHGVVLAGGSAFGLDAASGVMRCLEERGWGFPFGGRVVPVVASAILFDLGFALYGRRPGPQEGYRACLSASSGPVEQGSVGAGTGATVAKALGPGRMVKGGLGTASLVVGRETVVGALVAVNAFGDVVNPWTGHLVAGPRREGDWGFHSTTRLLLSGEGLSLPPPGNSTTIGVVATSARLNRAQALKLASMAHDGLALAVRPCHLMVDGDAFFALATGRTAEEVPLDRLATAAVVVVARAVLNALERATGLAGVPSVGELRARWA